MADYSYGDLKQMVGRKLGILADTEVLSAEDGELIEFGLASVQSQLERLNIVDLDVVHGIYEPYAEPVAAMAAAQLVDEFQVSEPKRGQCAQLELRVNHWSDGYTRAYGLKAGEWNRKENEKDPDVEASYDLLTGKVLDSWTYARGISLHFIRPGKPVENAFIESFNGKFRDECLNEHWFTGLADARFTIACWRRDYNQVRPHSSLGDLTPDEFARRAASLRSATPPSGSQPAGETTETLP